MQITVTASNRTQNSSCFSEQAAKQLGYKNRSHPPFSEAEWSVKNMGGARPQSHLTLKPVAQLLFWRVKDNPNPPSSCWLFWLWHHNLTSHIF